MFKHKKQLSELSRLFKGYFMTEYVSDYVVFERLYSLLRSTCLPGFSRMLATQYFLIKSAFREAFSISLTVILLSWIYTSF
jgi:hypothetical protein